MLPGKRLLRPAAGIHTIGITWQAMIAYKYKNGIIKIRLLFSSIHKFFKAVVGVSKSIELGIVFKAIFFYTVFGIVYFLNSLRSASGMV
jgi:hypothetical protein